MVKEKNRSKLRRFFRSDTGVTAVDTTLTKEQRLSDLEYMYDLLSGGGAGRA